jgi:farnesyl diphosphate synthase
MNSPVIKTYLNHHEKVLRTLIKEAAIPATKIREAITYALFPSGKRLRPLLVYLCGELLGVNPSELDIIAASIEITHCYSLVHDDLPAMDNDDFRRGKPSCHRAFDEATAILVGDGMQALAIDILLTHLPQLLSPERTIKITHELIKASGPSGMVSGQSLDLTELCKSHLKEPELRNIHLLKTGRLIIACINMVLLAKDQPPSTVQALNQFATHLGLVFQMQDDYLDRYSDTSILGKRRSSDAANQKTTFATLYTQNDLKNLIKKQFHEAEQAVSSLKQHTENLLFFTQDLQQRIKD